MEKQRMLFLCTKNSARSQMAEAFLRRHGGDEYEAYSAGLEAGGINPLTVRVMEEAGYDLIGHSSKSVKEYLGKLSFSYIVPVCHDAEESCPKIFPGHARIMPWGFEDPAAYQGTEEERLAKFREVRDLIEKKILDWLAAAG